MPKIASIFRSSLCLAAVLTVALPAGQAAALECADKEISARGPTFTPSPETSMEAAKTEWLKRKVQIITLPENDVKEIRKIGARVTLDFAKKSPEAAEYVKQYATTLHDLGYVEEASALGYK